MQWEYGKILPQIFEHIPIGSISLKLPPKHLLFLKTDGKKVSDNIIYMNDIMLYSTITIFSMNEKIPKLLENKTHNTSHEKCYRFV